MGDWDEDLLQLGRVWLRKRCLPMSCLAGDGVSSVGYLLSSAF